jgi:hypothetical protein
MDPLVLSRVQKSQLLIALRNNLYECVGYDLPAEVVRRISGVLSSTSVGLLGLSMNDVNGTNPHNLFVDLATALCGSDDLHDIVVGGLSFEWASMAVMRRFKLYVRCNLIFLLVQ